MVWPEIEGLLAHRDGWADDNIPELREAHVARIDPHHLAAARTMVLGAGRLQRTTGSVGGRDVITYVDAAALTGYGRKTTVIREAGRKRRLYGTLLGWTGTPRLCGQVAERQVAATLEHLAGRVVWLDPARGTGEVRELAGQRVPGGPLDHAGAIARDPAKPKAGFVDFVVEVKNVRQTLYPEHREIYDLLWKAGHFPEHVPVLIAPKVHPTTFWLFKAIGAVAYTSTRQSFAGPPGVPRERFRRVSRELSIPQMQQLDDPSRPSMAMAKWFSTTLPGASGAVEGKSLLESSEQLWRRAAPILARPEFEELRKQLGGHRRVELYRHLLEELENDGFDVDRLLPQHRLEDADEEVDISEYVDPSEFIDPRDFEP